jgi:hypothetical protein
MTELMPPKSDADNLEKRTVALPPALWQALQELAAADGEKLSEVYRRVIALGASAERLRHTDDLAYQNKRLINQRLRAKLAGAIEAVTTLEDLTPALDPADRATVAQAVAMLRTWLSE